MSNCRFVVLDGRSAVKFLCVPCDQAMTLREVLGPERGSVSLRYGCPHCGHEMAMLTNPHETQVVGSLGVRLGLDGEAASAASRCPMTGLLAGASSGPTRDATPRADDGAVRWTPPARERLENIPQTVRAFAEHGIAKFARDHGYDEVDVEVQERARAFFGM
jgi:predicted RNA-binding Zn-ribbon protein involved in translation (DUF1610 family)